MPVQEIMIGGGLRARRVTRARRLWRPFDVSVEHGNRGAGYVPPDAEYPSLWRRVGRSWTRRGGFRLAERTLTRV